MLDERRTKSGAEALRPANPPSLGAHSSRGINQDVTIIMTLGAIILAIVVVIVFAVAVARTPKFDCWKADQRKRHSRFGSTTLNDPYAE